MAAIIDCCRCGTAHPQGGSCPAPALVKLPAPVPADTWQNGQVSILDLPAPVPADTWKNGRTSMEALPEFKVKP